MNVLDVLRERGFIEQTTHDQELRDAINSGPIRCYIGFDPTASSLHIGSLVPIMSLAHMQRNGHLVIALVGGGTALVGDPSGKTEMRKMLTREQVDENAMGIRRQLSRFIDFDDGKAVLVNNADWLTRLEYIPFLRDIGRHFTVNRMLKAESYRMRLESEEGLNFIEFNYMLLQAYDFLELNDRFGCTLQMGGSDQWGNIIAGIELIRRTRQKPAFGITFPLITTSSGAKMGKTAKGAVWLDAKRTAPYEYYQYWVNVDDPDVARFLALFTFLPMDEIHGIEALKGADLNSAKAVLAFEATSLAHGRDEAVKAFQAACAMFGGRSIPDRILPSSAIPRETVRDDDQLVPHSDFKRSEIGSGIPIFKMFQLAGIVSSSGEARRLIQQGGAYLNGERVESFEYRVSENDFAGGEMLLRIGKKRYHKIRLTS